MAIAEDASTRTSLADEFLPVFDVSDSVAMVVGARPERTWRALLDADLVDVGRRRRLVGVLGALRALPEIAAQILRGEKPPPMPTQPMTLLALTHQPLGDGGWVLLGERHEDEIALGLVGRFWRPVIEFAAVPADEFATFDAPGYAKTVFALSVSELADGRTLLRGVMRTASTDEHARRWFHRYWTFGVGSGAHLLVHGLLDVVREDAEVA